ncbi:uncharacterized protein RCO7_09261 [Rhynchosporium graminicola]|uniref:Uncharacterized protein n=1 Tax=Rhynchosporium graminicola TaxID=2792576 RepID=A0A1E1KY75_9HELO|nr:uncharacterized protein RCO7_09261 [Rhynchosporium commune]
MEARFVSTTSKSHLDIVALVKEKAIRYMSSRPGRDESGGDTRCHSLCKQSIQGILESDRLLILNDMLNYRNPHLELAGRYAVKLGSSKDGIPDQFDQVEWHSSLNKDRISGSSVRKHRAADLKKRFADMLDFIDDLRLFDSPLWTQGFDYSKPPEYLAAKLA